MFLISKIYSAGHGEARNLCTRSSSAARDTTEVDTLAGIVVDLNQNIYVAGSTNSATFPTNGTNAPFQATPLVAGTHGIPQRV